jgi:hypothetical protein
VVDDLSTGVALEARTRKPVVVINDQRHKFGLTASTRETPYVPG